MKVQGNIVLVTGANRGLGASFVKALKSQGASKIYAGMREPKEVDVPGVTPVRLDVTNPETIAAATKLCGDATLVINNAGISLRKGFLASDAIEAARAELEVNYFGPLHMARAFAPILARNQGGAIINVLSVVSWKSAPFAATYCASKSAAWSLSNGLRAELRQQKTQVLSVHVGFVDTHMTQGIDAPKTGPDEVVRRVLSALEEGLPEVLVDESSRSAKAGLSQGQYLEA